MIDHLTAWLRQPYSEDMTAGGWFLFFGMFIVMAVAWSLILKSLKEVTT